MIPADVLVLFRNTVFDTEEEYLWADLEAIEYLNDAQSMLCRLVGGISDASTEDVTQIAYSEGDRWIDLHPSILKIKTVQRTSDFRYIKALNVENLMEGSVQAADDYGIQSGLRLDDSIGELLYLVLGMTDDRARLLRRPAEAGSLQLAVERLPLVAVSESNINSDVLEVRDEHHRHLVLWMAAQAYLKQDAETFDKLKAEDFEARFRGYCEQARKEKERRQHKPRVVAYGGY